MGRSELAPLRSPRQALRSHLGSFGIGGPLALQAAYTLSGGQKSRVALAKITWTNPHILLLDEPSKRAPLPFHTAPQTARAAPLHPRQRRRRGDPGGSAATWTWTRWTRLLRGWRSSRAAC